MHGKSYERTSHFIIRPVQPATYKVKPSPRPSFSFGRENLGLLLPVHSRSQDLIITDMLYI